MKKKFLVILLALTMVFAFSAAALATVVETPAANTTITFSFEGIDGVRAKLSNGTATMVKTDSLTADITISSAIMATVTVDGEDVEGEIVTVTKTNQTDGKIAKSGYTQITGTVNYTHKENIYAIPFTLDIYIGNDNANLKSITPNGCDAGYDKNTITSFTDNKATMYVDKDATKWSFEVAAVDSNATISINNGSNNSSITNGTDLSYKIKVTSENGKVTKEYTLAISKTFDVAEFTQPLKYNNNTIATIKEMTAGDIVTFSYPYGTSKNDELKFTTAFTGDLDFDIDKTDSEYIKVTKNTDGFTVEFKKAPAGERLDIDVILTSLDGDEEVSFTLRLNEAEPVLLDDMNIQIDGDDDDIDYNMFPTKFDDETFDYYVFVPYDGVSSITVNAQIEYDKDFDVSGMSSSGSKYHKLGTVSAGKSNTFTIKVEEDDNSSNYTEYKIHVYYAAKSADDDDALDDIEVRYGSSFRTKATISPSFSANTTNYVVSLPAKTEEARLYLDASDRDAIILCNDEVVDNYITLSDLKAGENKFKVVVVAENCDDTKTYNITVNVGATGLLSNLSFSTNAGTFNFSPVFASGTYNYVANVPNSVTTLYVTPTAIDDDYTIRVYKGSTDAQTVKSGKTSTGVALTEGLNEVKVYVYQSGSSKTYTLNIYRQPTAPNYQVSVQNLYVNGTAKTLNAVNIKGNNFLKLRDLAYLLDGTSKQFNVTYTESTNTTHIHSLTSYVNDPKNPVNQPITLTRPQLSSQKVTLDGSSAYPIAYNVAGSNYVNLRQVCAMLDIGLTYSAATNTVTITTANSYTPGL